MTAKMRKIITERLRAEVFTAQEVAWKTGATLRQLQYWDEEQLITPQFGQFRHTRLYSKEQVEVVRTAVQLRNAGVSMRDTIACIDLEGWNAVVVMDRPAVMVGKTLVVRSTKPRKSPRPRKAERSTIRHASVYSNCQLDRMALKDPVVAEGRKEARA